MAFTLPLLLLAIHLAIEVALVVRIMLRPQRDPASRVAWLAVVALLPGIGLLAYLLFGEVNIGQRRVARMRAISSHLSGSFPIRGGDETNAKASVPPLYESLFEFSRSVNGFAPLGGNSARLITNSNDSIDSIVADIDAAQDHVHLVFYIWLTDINGLKVAEALQRAARRGVTCRAIADSLGSRTMIGSPHWQAMRDAGVRLAAALPFDRLFLVPLFGRIDLRNHRKIVVIDDRITYCGSQNCADAEFRVKPKFAPWVDVMMRFEGPVARQNQQLFIIDWTTTTEEDLRHYLDRPVAVPSQGFTAQAIGTGPHIRYSAMPMMFESLIFASRHELVITTPYYVPDESMQNALCTAARRGVAVKLILPAKNDSWIVGGASRSYYGALLDAGVQVYEYHGGLLHTKSLTLDGQITLVGSANMDRRSFDLNFENNILLADPALTAEMRRCQDGYLQRCTRVTPQQLAAKPLYQQLWENALATLGPVL
jgi:cardiolipin synthase